MRGAGERSVYRAVSELAGWWLSGCAVRFTTSRQTEKYSAGTVPVPVSFYRYSRDRCPVLYRYCTVPEQYCAGRTGTGTVPGTVQRVRNPRIKKPTTERFIAGPDEVEPRPGSDAPQVVGVSAARAGPETTTSATAAVCDCRSVCTDIWVFDFRATIQAAKRGQLE